MVYMLSKLNSVSKQRISTAAGIIFTSILIMRCSGILRDILIAPKFGASSATDAFFMALVIPLAINGIMMNSISAAFIPILFKKESESGKNHYVNAVFTLILLVLVCITAIITYFAPFIISLIAPGFDDVTHRIASFSLRIIAVSIIFMGLNGLLASIFNAYKHFVVPSAVKPLWNGGIIFFVIALSGKLGIYSAVAGMILGIFLQFIIQYLFLIRKTPFRFHFTLKDFFYNIKEFIWSGMPIILSGIFEHSSYFVTYGLASKFEKGSVSILSFAFRIITIPASLSSLALGTAVFPSLAELANQNNVDDLKKTVKLSIGVLAYILLPILCTIVIFRQPIVSTIFEHGLFNSEASVKTSNCLLYSSLGILLSAASYVLERALFSLRKNVLVLECMVIRLAIIILSSLILMRWLPLYGLVLAFSLTEFIRFMILSIALSRIINLKIAKSDIVTYSKILLATIAFVFCLVLFNKYFIVDYQSVSSFLKITLNLSISSFVYVALSYLFKIDVFTLCLRRLYSIIRFKQI